MLLYRTKNFVSAETLLGGALAVGGLTANMAFVNSMQKDIDEKRGDKSDKKYRDLLISAFKRKHGNNNFLEIKDFGNASAVQLDNVDEVKEDLKQLSPEERKQLEELEKTDPYIHATLEIIRKSDLNNPVIVADPTFNSAAVISHEIGHTEYQTDEENGRNKFIKWAHKYPACFDNGGLMWGGLFGFFWGVAQQSKSATAEKVTRRLKNGVYVMATVDAGMVLACELAASKRGIELLKKLGATEEEIKKYKGTLMKAAGSYLSGSVMNVGFAMLGARGGRWLSHKLAKAK